MYDPQEIIFNAVSRYDNYCEGYNGQGKNYLLALNLATATVKEEFAHEGSRLLDEINAFDMAETRGALIGQINMITVSSFCGPMGAILGYDFLRPESDYTHLFDVQQAGQTVGVYDANTLIDASKALFGTIDNKQYPIIPGAHTFCAAKSIKIHGPAHIYSAIGLGIAKDRSANANLMMEDIGEIPLTVTDFAEYRDDIIHSVARSVVQVGINQKVEYEKIFVGIVDQYCDEDEVACALVASPYFTIAKSAIDGIEKSEFTSISLEDWKQRQ